MKLEIVTTNGEKDYELVDSGESEKLERFGNVLISRPDPQAIWPTSKSAAEWQKARAVFSREAKATWNISPGVPERWNIDFGGLKFIIRPTAFKHVGIFPEQAGNWRWIETGIKKSSRRLSILNLFGYTGGATLAAAKAGADVVHLDGSRTAINWAKENAELSGLKEKPIRWILDDARAFLKREIKRGKKYDGIIMDPPAFGHGPKGEVWKIEEHLLDLLDLCRQVLSDTPAFFLINGYASGYSALAYQNNLESIMKKFKGTIEMGELTLRETDSGRLLPAGIFARWRAL